MITGKALDGKPHVRSDERGIASTTPRRGSPFCKGCAVRIAVCAFAIAVSATGFGGRKQADAAKPAHPMLPAAGPRLSLPAIPVADGARLLPAWAALTNAAAVADVFAPGAMTLPAEFIAPGAVRLPVDFTAAKSHRATWDLKFPCDMSSEPGIEFDFVCGDLSQFASFCCYFKSGNGWYKAVFAPDEDGVWRHVRVPKSRFRKEGEVGGWERVTTMRISCWRAGTGRTVCAIANVAASCRESASERERMREERRPAIRAWLAECPSKAGEHRAFWCHSARGIGGGRSWDDTIRFLKEMGFNAVLPNLCWGGVAFYDSKVLPVSPDVATRGDALKDCLAACRKYGVKCHVWKVNWNLGRGAPQALVDRMVAGNRVQRSFAGEVRKRWLCPSHPDNQKLEIDAMCELARMGVDGIHFDYIRYPDDGHCFCAGCRARFEAFAGAALANWPAQVRTDAALGLKWAEFRASNITAVVRAVAERVRAESPGVEISAAVFNPPATNAARVAQDWPRWCREGWLDFVCPMDYIESAAMFKSQARMQRGVAGKARLYPGIGLSCWMNDDDVVEDAVRFAKQIQAVRDLGLGGFTVFNLDRRAEAVLPLLRLGVTKDD